ncbi:MAG: metalloregulator ArsR/SmtB family transcription factor [Actinomycetota bacterium]
MQLALPGGSEDPTRSGADVEDGAFKALGHRDRRALLRVIADDEVSVGTLAEATALEQPVVSQHLKVLRTAGLVSVRVEGNRRFYSVDFGRFAELRRFLDLFWNTKLGDLKERAERDTEGPTS